MIHNLKPYPAYKDSGVLWLGEVPEHWEVKRNKLFLREINERSEDGSEELLTVSQYTGVTARRERLIEENGLLTNAASLVGYKRVIPGDLVMNIMLAWNGSLGVSPITGIASPAYCVYRATTNVEPRFFHYLFRTPLFTGVFKTTSTGVVDSRLRLYPEVFFRMPSLLPPKAEQFLIVRYLDYMDWRIRRYIRAKQKLIKLLEEQKQAIIHQAVTRGLDPSVKLKQSGVEWLGDVPEHWEVVSLRRVTIARCDGPFGSGLKSSHYTEHGIRVVRLTNIGHAEFRNSDAAFISPMHYTSLGDHSVKAGDVLIAGLGDERHPAGRACVAPAEILPAMVKADCFRFRLKENRINPKFAALQLTATAVAASAILSTGATRQRTNLQSTAGRTITIPPFLEQEAILDYISENTSALNIAIDRAHIEISLLREYRTRLIADVVTGKLDVRKVAANLSEETEDVMVEEDSGEEIKEEELEEIVTEEND